MNLKKSLVILTVFTAVVAALFYLADGYRSELVYRHIWLFVIYFYFLSAIIFTLLNFAVAKNKGAYALFFFGFMIVRFFLSVIFVFIIMFVDRQNLMTIGINFVILYLLFLGLDIYIGAFGVRKYSKQNPEIHDGKK